VGGEGSQTSPTARQRSTTHLDPAQQWHSDTNSTAARLGVVEELQARVEKLERLLSSEHRYAPESQHGLRCTTPGMLTIKGTRSRYHTMDQKLSMVFRVSAEYCALGSTKTSSSMKPCISFTASLTIPARIPRRGNS
jgi:hypothetical protein